MWATQHATYDDQHLSYASFFLSFLSNAFIHCNHCERCNHRWFLTLVLRAHTIHCSLSLSLFFAFAQSVRVAHTKTKSLRDVQSTNEKENELWNTATISFQCNCGAGIYCECDDDDDVCLLCVYVYVIADFALHEWRIQTYTFLSYMYHTHESIFSEPNNSLKIYYYTCKNKE